MLGICLPDGAYAAALRKDAFLSSLWQARGFEGKPDVRENASLILKSGVVPEAVSKLDAPLTRREALRWAIHALGLSVEAGILSGLDLPFRDVGGLSEFERGCLVVAIRMKPALFENSTSSFRPGAVMSQSEAQTLLANVRRASRYLKLNERFAPAPGMDLEVYREGSFSGIPKWRVYVDGFDENTEVESLRGYFAAQGFKLDSGNPNYEWRLRSALFEDYAQVRRLSALAKAKGKAVRIFPSVMNANLENQPLFWSLLTIDPVRYEMKPIISPQGLATLAPLSSMLKNSGAKAAINAGFFAVSGRNRGAPIGVLRIDRFLVNKPHAGRTSLGWSKDNKAAFGEVSWSGNIRIEEGWMPINSLNRYVKGNTLVLYSAHYVRPTPVNEQVTEIVVKGGKCIAVGMSGGSIVEPGSWVLAGYGTNAALLARHIRPGDDVLLEDSFNGEGSQWGEMDDMIQAGPLLIRNGEIKIQPEGFNAKFINLRHPRSVMGLTKDGKWAFFVGDGRNGMHSAGFTLDETARILKIKGVVYALNLDGGGSTQLMVGNKLFNYPSDGRERPISYGVGAMLRQQR